MEVGEKNQSGVGCYVTAPAGHGAATLLDGSFYKTGCVESSVHNRKETASFSGANVGHGGSIQLLK